jgi:phenylalanine-4-hydroxylase
VEFGLCKQEGALRAYGAGLLSSFGELEYCLSGKAECREFNPSVTCTVKYPITQYQPTYFVAETFEKAKEQMREFAATLKRPFQLRYNAYTQAVEILDTREKLVKLANEIKSDAGLLA